MIDSTVAAALIYVTAEKVLIAPPEAANSYTTFLKLRSLSTTRLPSVGSIRNSSPLESVPAAVLTTSSRELPGVFLIAITCAPEVLTRAFRLFLYRR